MGAPVLAVVGTILPSACANVAGLFVARVHQRGTEMAVRSALGGSRHRIVRTLLAEGLWPGFVSALLGVGRAEWAVRSLRGLELAVELPIRLDVRHTPRVLATAFGVALLAALAISRLPALAVPRSNVVGAVEGRHGGRRAGLRSLRGGLVVLQCTTPAVLVAGAMLALFQTLLTPEPIDAPGYDRPEGHRGRSLATRCPPATRRRFGSP